MVKEQSLYIVRNEIPGEREAKKEMKDIIKGFARYLKHQGLKPVSIDEYVRAVRMLSEYLGKTGKAFNEVRYKDALNFIHSLTLKETNGRNYSRKTINYKISYLRRFYIYLVTSGLALENPFNNIDRLKEEDRITRAVMDVK